MNNPFRPNRPGVSQSDMNAVMLTAPMFFGAEGIEPYFTKRDFLSYGESLRDSEVVELRSFFSYVKEGLRMEGNIRLRKDKANRPYIYPRFYRVKAIPGAKVILSGELERFILDYQNGEININFSLDDLIIEARIED